MLLTAVAGDVRVANAKHSKHQTELQKGAQQRDRNFGTLEKDNLNKPLIADYL